MIGWCGYEDSRQWDCQVAGEICALTWSTDAPLRNYKQQRLINASCIENKENAHENEPGHPLVRHAFC